MKGKAWRAIGRGPKLFDLEAWLTLMCNMRAKLGLTMDPSSPLFLMEDGRHLIYAKAVNLMREVMDTFLPAGESMTFSVGGVRVLAYNIFKSVCGDTTARVQGMWGSDAHELYDRGDLAKILDVPSRMLGFSMDPNSVPKAQLEVMTPLVANPTLTKSTVPAVETEIPEGWTRVYRDRPGLKKSYPVFVRASDGKVVGSLPAIARVTEFVPTAKQAKRTKL